jgi:hypothetical protein
MLENRVMVIDNGRNGGKWGAAEVCGGTSEACVRTNQPNVRGERFLGVPNVSPAQS